jgi:cellulose synthase/poly-beta-1,6-N-acetylglucosamine synthase-like glycosyltransferase
MIYVLIFLSAFYVAIILYHLIGWELTKDIPLSDTASDLPFCTIIVPVRNEEKNISACLDSLLEQNYAGDYEVIVVDDHSTDETTAIVQHRIGKLFVNGHRHLKLLRFEGEQQIGKSYKKQAITKAIAAAAGDIILTTDGDCSRGNNWLTVMVSTMEQQQLQLLSGPVGLITATTLRLYRHWSSGALLVLVEQPYAWVRPTCATGPIWLTAKKYFMK